MPDQKYLIAKARNTVTGQTVKNQDLTGFRYTESQRNTVQQLADVLAEKMSVKTRQTWQGYVEEYTPTERR